MQHRISSGAWLLAMAVVVVCTVLLAPDCASACSCAAPAGVSPQQIARQEFSRSDAVFTGEVVAIDRPLPVVSSMEPMTVTFRVSEAWKGAGQETLEVKTAVSDASCGYPFDEDERYLVFASKGETYDARELEVALCGSTKQLSEAGTELAALGTGATPAEEQLPDTSGVDSESSDPAWIFLFASGIVALLLAMALARSAGRR